jgi:hypothetical protein
VITRKPHNWIIRIKSPVRLCAPWRFARFLTFLHGYLVMRREALPIVGRADNR